MNQKGFTLFEVMISLAIFSLVLAGMAPALVAQLKFNSRSQIRTEGAAAAAQVLDAIRLLDPATLPTSGSGAATTIAIGPRTYVVTPTYCLTSSLCSSSTKRHITVSVINNNEEVFETETVFTQLR